MSPASMLQLATCVYAVLLAAAAWLTRATARRFLGALAGGGAVAVVGAGIESLAHAMKWWRYPFTETPYGPPLMYPVLVLVFTLLSLIGWRIMRRFGGRGVAMLLGGIVAVGMPRDYIFASRFPQFLVMGRGIVPALVDGACWLGMTALALAVMRAVAGPAASDRLARGARTSA